MPQIDAFGATGDQPNAQPPVVNNQPTAEQQKIYTFQEGDRTKTFTGSDEMFNAYTNSQSFIGTLKNEKSAVELELEELKTKYSELNAHQVSTQEVIDKINGQQVPPAAQPQSVDQNEIVTAVREQMMVESQEQSRQDNVTKANSALTGVYGDSAAEHVAKVAGENGMTVQDAINLAANNPTLFSNTFLPSKQNAAFTSGSSPQAGFTTTQAQQSPASQPESKLMWQQKEMEAVSNLRTQREEMRKQMQL